MELLKQYMNEGLVSFFDFALAMELLGEEDEETAAFLCHLSMASRQGHLCVEIQENAIYPDIPSIWNLSASNSLFVEQLQALILAGSKRLPARLITHVDPLDVYHHGMAVQTPLGKMQSRVYLQRYWFYETSFLSHYFSFTSQSPKISIDPMTMQTLTHQLQLLPEQEAAILHTANHSFTMICGGPGTGKTYTAGRLLCALWEALTTKQRENFKMALAAPTGKAAANLQKSLQNASKGIKGQLELQAKTLHALLGIKNSGLIRKDTSILPYDLIIVDEASMIDVRLMSTLFSLLKPGSRLILLGDPHQLPSVEAGSVFSDLVSSNQTAVISLKHCLRAELAEILQMASAVKNGHFQSTLELFSSQKAGIQRLEFPEEMQSIPFLVSYALDCYQIKNISFLDPHQLLEHFNQFRILTPLRKGLFGVEELNNRIAKEMRSLAEASQTPLIAPIILLKNDYSLDLFNGEIGVLVRSAQKEEGEISQEDYAFFEGKQGEIVRIPALLLPAFEYAFCLSVHKSQGSEFNHLLLLLPSGSERFGREVLYTAITRAKRQLTFWGTDATLKATLSKHGNRLSGIPERLSKH